MDWSKLASQVIHMAEQVAPAIIPGAGPAIAIANKVLELGKEVKQQAPAGQTSAQLDASLDALEAKVMAHADRTISSLGDGPT